jgi:hypothetical protein
MTPVETTTQAKHNVFLESALARCRTPKEKQVPTVTLFEVEATALVDEVERLRRLLEPFARFAEARPRIADCVPLRLDFNGEPGASPTLLDCRRAMEGLKQ